MERKEERRKYVRRPVEGVLEAPERISANWSGEPLNFACQGVDISEGGMQIVTTVQLRTGQHIKLTLRSRGGRSLSAEAEVRWVKPEKNAFRAGLEFLEKKEEFIV